MKVVFFGTPYYVLPVLKSLQRNLKDRSEKSPIAAVVTQNPKPVGRKKKIEYSPIDNWAHKREVPVIYDPSDLIKKNIKADIGILASYGKIIPQKVIDHFPYGILNIHPSDLPEFRGSSPAQATILTGNARTKVTIIKLTNKLDAGPIVSQYTEEVSTDDTAQTLRDRMFERSAGLLPTLIPPYIQGKIKPMKQDDKSATFTKTLTKADGFIPPNFLDAALNGKSAKKKWKIGFIKNYTLYPDPYSLECFIRAMQDWPVAWTEIAVNKQGTKKRLKIFKGHIKNNKLVLDEVQLEGRNKVSWEQFKAGYPKSSFL